MGTPAWLEPLGPDPLIRGDMNQILPFLVRAGARSLASQPRVLPSAEDQPGMRTGSMLMRMGLDLRLLVDSPLPPAGRQVSVLWPVLPWRV